VSKSPLRRLSENLLLTSMRPALTEQALRRRRDPGEINGVAAAAQCLFGQRGSHAGQQQILGQPAQRALAHN